MRHVQYVVPREDTDFVALVDRVASDTDDPAELQRRLRDAYPRIVVRPRGLSGDHIEMWYVYRDGSWAATRAALTTAERAPWRSAGVLMTDAEGRYHDADAVALDLLGVSSVAELRATPVTAFQPFPVDPAEELAFREAFTSSAARGLFGEGAIRRLDGELVRVRTAILPDDDSGYRVLLYPIERPTTNVAPRLYEIADVLAEWQSAERRFVRIDPESEEGRQLAAGIDFLHQQHELMFQRQRAG